MPALLKIAQGGVVGKASGIGGIKVGRAVWWPKRCAFGMSLSSLKPNSSQELAKQKWESKRGRDGNWIHITTHDSSSYFLKESTKGQTGEITCLAECEDRACTQELSGSCFPLPYTSYISMGKRLLYPKDASWLVTCHRTSLSDVLLWTPTNQQESVPSKWFPIYLTQSVLKVYHSWTFHPGSLRNIWFRDSQDIIPLWTSNKATGDATLGSQASRPQVPWSLRLLPLNNTASKG